MREPPSRRRLVLALLASALLHLLALLVSETLWPRPLPGPVFRPRLVRAPPPLERYRPRPAPPVPAGLLERLRLGIEAPRLPPGMPARRTPVVSPEFEVVPLALDTAAILGVRQPWAPAAETLAVSRTQEVHVTELPLADPVALATEGLVRTAVLIDAETGKLKQAYLHVPAYAAGLDCSGQVFNPSRALYDALGLARRGFRIPGRLPVRETVHTFPLGLCCRSGNPGVRRPIPDPLHLFTACPARHLLRFDEMREYAVLPLSLIDVASTSEAVRYLLEGGFVIADGGRLDVLAAALRQRVEARVQAVRLELGHPLFHAFYDITRYLDGNRGCGKGPPCAPVGPVAGLEVDGRLVAATSPPFNPDCPCPANQLHVNVLAFALIQPSPMGGRYLDR